MPMRKFVPTLAIGLLYQFLVCGCTKPDDDPPPPPPPAPVIVSATPADAASGETLTITGNYFDTAVLGNTVTVGGIQVKVISASATLLKVVFPNSVIPSGSLTIGVTASGQTANYSLNYTRPAVVVTTFAGNKSLDGLFKDGSAMEAIIDRPSSIDIDANGNLFVADATNNRIRKITPDGNVTTFAGDGTSDVANNFPTAKSLGNPVDVAINKSTGDLYVIQYQPALPTPYIIRKITTAGTMSIFATTVDECLSITVDPTGNLIVGMVNQIRKISPTGVILQVIGNGKAPTIAEPGDGPVSTALIGMVMGMAFKGNDLFFSDYNTKSIRKITGMATVSNYAGVPFAPTIPFPGANTDGTLTTARFNFPWGLAINTAGDLYVSEYMSGSVKKIAVSGDVNTIAGPADTYKLGYKDGNGKTALFYQHTAMVTDAAGNVYVCDGINRCIRKISF
jgi:hypothetical protein